ncbi:MAG: hypothetical protein ACRD1O_07005 [Terriglobia bacterium]
MVSEFEIREWLSRLVAQEITLDVFEDWFVSNTWNIHRQGGDEAQKLAYAVELRLAEHSSGHLNSNGLRRELEPFVSRYARSIGQPQQTIRTESSSTVLTYQAVQTLSADIRPSGVSALEVAPAAGA